MKDNELKLLTVVVTDFYSSALLMVACVDELCLRLTFCTKVAHYYNCVRNSILVKDAESGNLHSVQSVYYDCDFDALNFRVLIISCGCVRYARRLICFL